MNESVVRQFPARPAPAPVPARSGHAGDDQPFLVVATVVFTAVRRVEVEDDPITAATVAAATVGETLRVASTVDGELPAPTQAELPATARVVLLKATTLNRAVADGALTVQATQVLP